MKKLYPFSFPRKRKTFNFKSIVLGFAMLIGGKEMASAQVSAYTFSQSSGTYTPITGTVLDAATGNTSTTNLNSNIYPLSLPFDFVFNGTTYNSVNISTNGFITFGATAPTATTTSPISGTSGYDGAVAAWGRDLGSVFDINGTTGNISWTTTGTAPNREVVIQWKDFRAVYSTSTTNVYVFSFQVVLQETSNIIKTIYNDGAFLVGNTAVSSTAQIGLRGSSNSDFNNRLNASSLEFINSTAGTSNSSSQSFNSTNAVPGMPPAGLTYSWTPPSCYAPSGLSAGATAANTAAISWSASPSAPGTYDVYYSTSNTAPTSSTPPSIPPVSGTSATLNSLAPSSVYYIWVRSNCGSGNTSIWSLQPIQVITQCQPPSVITSSGATVCPGQTATLSATTGSGSVLLWYDASTGGNNIGTGNSYTTPALASTTDYWVSAATIGSDSYVGKDAPTATTGNSTFTDYGLVFDAYSQMTIKEVDVYPMGSGTTGTVTINLKNSSGTILATKTATVNVTTAGVLNTITLDFNVPAAGNDYRLVVDGASGISNLRREISSGFTYPYVLPGICSIKAARFGSSPSQSYYYYLYNWKVSGICESDRTMVTATVNCLSTSEVNTKDAMKVYPNPFRDRVTITDNEKVKSIQVFDALGRMVKTIDNVTSKEIDLGDLNSGLYVLTLSMKDGSSTHVKAIKK
ncbi:T9SS type A sorting domain-containing protein [Chryseobacterium sp.]|uniref:Ig-like domain-containing protein n=1 Tax=Chryseobacterium sp. TaxID=1871047 RepID=UPI00289A8D83|nr:T9SS type A sorting domain-containing protein [Chryseobacterium sp.]